MLLRIKITRLYFGKGWSGLLLLLLFFLFCFRLLFVSDAAGKKVMPSCSAVEHVFTRASVNQRCPID